jgi:hypothetical protein
MKKKTQYVFGAALAGVAIGGVVDQAHAALVTAAAFTFETSGLAFSTSVTQGASPFGPVLADVGVGSAYGSHAATNAVYSSPAGNGSLHSISSNNWAVGDYYEFKVPTTGIQNIQIAFDQISSGSGPDDFELVVSPDGTSFDTVGTYSIPFPAVTGTGTTSGTPSVTGTQTFWGAGTFQTWYNHSFDLSGLTALNNNSDPIFLLVDLNTLAFSSSAGVQAGGSDRVDNFVVSGTAVVPEPAELTLLTVAAAGLLFRRRSNR